MQQYIMKRILLMLPVIFGISLITFTFMRIIPGDVVDVMYADSELGSDDIQKIREQLGMDKPFVVQYWDWMSGIARLDAGTSLWTERPVLEEIADRLPVTLELALLAFVLQIVIAVPVGVYAATHQDQVGDQFSRFWAILGTAAPDFWIATLVILFLASIFGWIPPIGGVAPFFEDPFTNLQQFFIPSLIVGLRGAGILIRLTRNTLLEVIRQDYIRTAFAKGLTTQRVWYVHAVKNAMIPVVTSAGAHLAFLMGGTVIIETIFGLPGLGLLTFDSIGNRDIPQLETNVLFLASIFVFVNLVVDLSYGWLDPRIRYR